MVYKNVATNNLPIILSFRQYYKNDVKFYLTIMKSSNLVTCQTLNKF